MALSSDFKVISDCGVPQSSVLGPILFLLFIGNIKEALKDCIIKVSSDDTNFSLSNKNFNMLKNKVISELSCFQTWVDANKLTINYDPKKSCYNIFRPAGKSLPDNYNEDLPVGNDTIQYQHITKYLAIILGDGLIYCYNIG